jgi:hypothetical protein
MNYNPTPETLLWQKRAGIITETQHNNMLEVLNFLTLMENETPSSEFDNLVKKVSAETDLKDKDNQLAFLDTLIDTGFQPEKVDPKKITEYKEAIEEDAGAVGLGLDVLESAEVLEQLAHALHVKPDVIKKAVAYLKKVFELPFTVIKKFFFTIARYFGASVETASKFGIGGLAVVGIICLVYGILHFPGILAGLSGGFGIVALGKLGWALIKGVAGIRGLYKKFKAYKKEVGNVYSTNDFLTNIEKAYKEKTGEKFKTADVYTMQEWYSSLPAKSNQVNLQTLASNLMKDIADAITQNKKNSGDLGKLERLIRLAKDKEEGKKVAVLLQKLKNTFPENLL